jgi:arginyl-tRNA synthetase
MKDSLREALTDALAAAQDAGRLPRSETPEFVIEVPRQADHGDLASNLAMQLARPLRMNPRAIAETLLDMLGDGGGILEKAEIAGPGFINFFLKPGAWLARLPQIAAQGTEFGRGDWGAGRRVMVEFVSANPTGPLHVGHGRGAALGDALARLLRFSGFETASEYYINDAGNQMAALGRSVLFRARELRPLNNTKEPFPDKHYQGEYIKDLAEQLLQERGGDFLAEPEEQAAAMASAYASQAILAGIREDLAVFGVEMDNWFSERAMVESGEVDRAFKDLEERGLLY